MLQTAKSFVWLSCVILLCMTALGLMIGQGRLQDTVIRELVPHIVTNQQGVIVESDQIQGEGTYTGGQILYSLREWLQDGVSIMIDHQVMSPKFADDVLGFPPTLPAEQLDVNAEYVAEFTYLNSDIKKIQVIQFKRK